jgi:ABC-type dipeptide/oligopeptide/nickel transport system permease component
LPLLSLAGFLLRRAAAVLPLLFAVLLVTFLLVRLGDQDPVALLAGPTASATELAAVRAELALDQPVWQQFALYLGRLLSGDLGRSWLSGRPVASEILDRVPATLELLVLGVGLGALVGIPVGLAAARRRNRLFDQVSRFLSLLGFSIPTYWLGLAMLLVFFYLLDWAPPGMGRLGLLHTPPPRITGSYLLDALLAGEGEVALSALSQLMLPMLCVAIIAAGPIVKQTRAVAVDVMASDYLRYGRAMGLGAGAQRAMVMRNIRVPVITFVGSELVGLVGTTSLIEYVFAWGGVGQLGLNAVVRGDFAVVQAYVLTLGLFSVLVFLTVDLLAMALEPRSRAA